MKNLITILLVFMATMSFSQLTYTKDFYGTTIVKDTYGNIVAKGSNDYNGNYVWKDIYGRVIYTQSQDPYGNIVTKDSNGKIISIYKNESLQPIGGGVQVYTPQMPVYNVTPIQALPAPTIRTP